MTKSLKINTILNIVKTCSSIIFPVITFPYVTRTLLPDNLGKVNFGLSVVNYFSLIATLGISTYAVRACAEVKNDKNKLSETASQIFSINLISTAIAYLLLALSLIFFSKLQSYQTIIIIQSSTLLFTALGADWLNSAMEDFTYIAIRSVAFQILSLILIFSLVKQPEDYLKYAMVSVISASGASITNIWYRQRFCEIKFTNKLDIAKHIAPILSLFVMTLSTTIFNNVDMTMLGIMWNDYEVGIYSTALKLERVISQVVQSVILVLIPRLTVFFANEDFEKANGLLRKLLSFNLSLGLPCVVGTIMLSKDIVAIMGGPGYEKSAPVLCILILCFLFSLVGGSFLGNAILIPMKKEKYYMVVCLFTAIANIILNAILIPRFGAIGAAIATAFNGIIVFLLLLFKVDKRIHIENISKLFFSPLVGCIIIIICCLLSSLIPNIWERVLVSIFSSIILYGTMLYILKNELFIETLQSVRLKLFKKIRG